MHTLFNVVVAVQVLAALVIVVLVLLQHGKGADMGAAFGSGASGSLFGATGASNFLSKSTGIAAVIFFSATLALSFFITKRGGEHGVMGSVPVKTAAPAANLAPSVAKDVVPVNSAPAASAASVAKQTNQTSPANQIPR